MRPGQVAELEYKAPLWSFSAGALGVGPQKYNGVGITLAVVAIPFIMLFLVILLRGARVLIRVTPPCRLLSGPR